MPTTNRTERKAGNSAGLRRRALLLAPTTIFALAVAGCDPSGDLGQQAAEQLAMFIQDFLRQWLAALLF